jgi:hypothetical protein
MDEADLTQDGLMLSMRRSRKPTKKGAKVNKNDVTCIDSDDDDFEFDDARQEEEDDLNRTGRSAYMVSRRNVAQYASEQSMSVRPTHMTGTNYPRGTIGNHSIAEKSDEESDDAPEGGENMFRDILNS